MMRVLNSLNLDQKHLVRYINMGTDTAAPYGAPSFTGRGRLSYNFIDLFSGHFVVSNIDAH